MTSAGHSIPNGYKHTEIGLIPEDWKVVSVGELASFKSGEGINIASLALQSPDTPVPVYGGNGIAGFTSRAIVTEQVVVVGRVGQKCGEVYLTGGPAWISDNALYPHAFHRKLDVRCLALALSYAGLNDVKNRNDLPLVTQSILHSVRIPFPQTHKEQVAISDAVSDTQDLIESLEHLLAKKRYLMQGAVRELLTGKRRLAGFSDKWEVKWLGELGSTYGGLTGKTKTDFGEGLGHYVTFMNVMTNVVIDCSIFERVKVSPTESQNRVIKGDLLFNGSSETPEEVAMCAVLAADVPDLFLNSFCFGFRFRDRANIDGLFLAYLLRGTTGREMMKSLAQGSTRYNLSKTALLKSRIRVPSLPEQNAIARLLSDMDGEIAAIETKLFKARQIKQGMMQELLTGRIRLV